MLNRKELGIDKDDGSETILQKFKERLEGKDVPKEAKEAGSFYASSQAFHVILFHFIHFIHFIPFHSFSSIVSLCPEAIDSEFEKFANLAKAKKCSSRRRVGRNRRSIR